jgi:hypothetical protein
MNVAAQPLGGTCPPTPSSLLMRVNVLKVTVDANEVVQEQVNPGVISAARVVDTQVVLADEIPAAMVKPAIIVSIFLIFWCLRNNL